jgi:esterase/lipase superfamily enzyme
LARAVCLLLAAGPVGADEGREITELLFLTNRSAGAGDAPADAFGNRTGALSGGICRVDTAARGGRGSLESVSPQSAESVYAALEADAAKGLIVYVHGYYEDFERSCRRAAVFRANLGLEQQFLLFSWPANSTPLTYGADVADLEASTPVITDTIREIARRIGPQSLSVVAHSLGTRGTVEAMQAARVADQPLRDLVLLASDMDRDRFAAALPELRQRVARITLLVSSRDLPLRVSRVVNGTPRLGQVGVDPAQDVTIVDVSDLEGQSLSGHIYHLRSEAVLARLREILGRP